ncbi:unnamed protein product [Nezara viridula]|uniref:Peptidase S1 domain-containing protein n=1 Tax=Nezara viridula TaxID=85310 RepID=A0A9P0HG02_NEZVI|nr:unnamed protein product [Nezara viridula]
MLPQVLLFFLLSGPDWINTYEIGDCGIRYNKFVPSISYGSSSKANEFPWHVALYRMDNSSKYEYICGGSIIDTNVVLTAAHCVFDEAEQDLDYSRMVVATGKHNGSWEHRDVFEQRFEVISKKVRPTYRGTDNRNQDDIALLALNDSIKFSSVVMPVCIDWGGLYEPYEEELGMIVGWGFNEKKVLSEELQISEMQQRNFGECRNNVGKGYTSYLTSDKFCAISNNNSTVEQGDSGGGLVFSRNQGENETDTRYFVKGILSGREKGSRSYVIYTNISNHMPWLNSTLMTIIAETNVRKVCGLRHPQNSSNEIMRYEEYPWLATIYMTKKNKFFGIRCVGSIIHQRAIITSFWCIQDRRPHYKGVEYKILVGKNELNMKEDEETQQELNIVKIHKHQNYIDWNARSENEMVIIIVDKEIDFTESVAPICIDWDRKFPIQDASLGMIASWDIDECHCQVMAMYKYLDIDDCSQAFGDSEEYQTYITSEKVCGRYVNGSNFMHGSDVGAGYFFLKNGSTRHYLQGIVSRGRPTHQEFLTFTNVELNLRWISDILVTIYNTGSW